MGNQMQQLFFQFQPSCYGDLGLKIPKARGGPKKNCPKIWIYCIQNDRTEHTNSTKRKKIVEFEPEGVILPLIYAL